MQHTRLKLLVSLGAGVLILGHLLLPNLNIDAITLGLFVLLILPWLSPLIKSAEFPGGWKIEFQEVQAAGAKVTEGNIGALETEKDTHASYLDISSGDPNLALVGLGIEIEKRLRALARKYQIREDRSMGQLLNDLRRNGVLNDSSASGLQELIMARNQAAHGAEVDPAAASWAFDFGPQILAVLDRKLKDER